METTMETTIEYRVRPVTRYVVTRFEMGANTGASTTHGEFDNAEVAHEVGYALCKAEHDRLGWPIGDMRIKYPDRFGMQIGGATEDRFPLVAGTCKAP
jgi:hypothetical protein